MFLRSTVLCSVDTSLVPIRKVLLKVVYSKMDSIEGRLRMERLEEVRGTGACRRLRGLELLAREEKPLLVMGTLPIPGIKGTGDGLRSRRR